MPRGRHSQTAEQRLKTTKAFFQNFRPGVLRRQVNFRRYLEVFYPY